MEQLFPFLGVRFIAINDHYDSDKTEGGLDIAFKNLVYDIYSKDLSKKVGQAREQMATQGKLPTPHLSLQRHLLMALFLLYHLLKKKLKMS